MEGTTSNTDTKLLIYGAISKGPSFGTGRGPQRSERRAGLETNNAEADQLSNGLNLQVKPLAFLEVADDLKQIPGLRVAVGAEHAHQALG